MIFGLVIRVMTIGIGLNVSSGPVVQHRIDQVREFLSSGKKESAYPLLLSLASEQSTEPDVYLYLGVIERDRKKYDKAIRIFERGLEVDNHHVGIRAELAMTYAWKGRFDDSLNAYAILLAAQPQHKGAQLGRARVLAWAGKHADALGVYEGILVVEPNHLEALRGTAFVYRSRMRTNLARGYYERVLAIDPHDQEALEGLRAPANQTRWQTEGRMGVVHFAPKSTSIKGIAGISFDINSALRLYTGYETDVPSGVGATTGDKQVIAHSAKLGLLSRIGHRLTFDGFYEFRAQLPRITHRMGLRGSLKILDRLVVLVGGRPGIRHDRAVEVLADVGLQYLPLDRFWLMAQAFYYVDSTKSMSWTAIGTMWWRFIPRMAARWGGGAGQSGGKLSLPLFAGLSLSTSKKIDLNLQYEYLHVPVVRHAGVIGTVIRF